MEILEATFDGLEEGIFTRVKVKVKFNDGVLDEGFILFENDGRDIEFEGFTRPYEDFEQEWVELDEAGWAKLEQPCAEGSAAYEAFLEEK